MSDSPPPPPDGQLLLPKGFLTRQQDVQKRKVSTMSNISNMSRTSTVEEFINLKEEELDQDHELARITQEGYESLRDSGLLDPKDCTERIKALNEGFFQTAEERNNMKRYKKLYVEDISDVTPPLPTFEQLSEAYADTQRLFAINASNARKDVVEGSDPSKQIRQRFKDKVIKDYAAERLTYKNPTSKSKEEVWMREKYCHLTGWNVTWVHGQPKDKDQSLCKVAHIVPHSLATSQIAYVFGTADPDFLKTDPRNALCLHESLEAFLDLGDILIIPIKSPRGQPSRWKCVVTDPQLRISELIFAIGIRFKDMHNRELSFLNDFRPANRYMYYKYVTTFLINENVNRLDWLDDLPDAGKMWASPGPYLRSSYLTVLARTIGDVYLPEVFFEMIQANSFEESESAPALSKDREELMMETSALEIMSQRSILDMRKGCGEFSGDDELSGDEEQCESGDEE